jgi:PhnB protein
MSRVKTFQDYSWTTEEAFQLYRSIFEGNFSRGGIARFRDIQPCYDLPAISEHDKNLIMRLELPNLGGHLVVGSGAPESMGFNLNRGNNISINLEPDTREETKKYSMHYARADKSR